jgi:hypothetical protein
MSLYNPINDNFHGFKFDIILIRSHQSEITMSEETENTVNTLIGTLCLIGSILLFWCCLYQYAICQQEKEKARRTYINSPKQQSLNALI